MKRRTKIIIRMSLGLLGLPVAFFVIFAAYLNYVAPSSQEMDVCQFVVVGEPQTYYEGKIDAFHVELRDIEGRCVLTYLKKDSTGDGGPTDLEVGMTAPCNFIRARWKEFEPQSYTYQTSMNKRKVLLVTGGTPDSVVKDEFQPNGCGTWLAKIRFFDDRIEIARTGSNGPPWCPSEAADEVFFAT